MANISEKQMINWYSKAIVNEVISKPFSRVGVIIADSIDKDNYLSGYWCIGDYTFERLLTKKKHKRAHSYFYRNRSLEFQEKVIDAVKKYKGITVKEEIEEFRSWYKPKNYKKTYYISVTK